MSVFKQSDGLTEEAARQLVAEKHPEETIQKATLGLFKEQAAWGNHDERCFWRTSLLFARF